MRNFLLKEKKGGQETRVPGKDVKGREKKVFSGRRSTKVSIFTQIFFEATKFFKSLKKREKN